MTPAPAADHAALPASTAPVVRAIWPNPDSIGTPSPIWWAFVTDSRYFDHIDPQYYLACEPASVSTSRLQPGGNPDHESAKLTSSRRSTMLLGIDAARHRTVGRRVPDRSSAKGFRV